MYKIISFKHFRYLVTGFSEQYKLAVINTYLTKFKSSGGASIHLIYTKKKRKTQDWYMTNFKLKNKCRACQKTTNKVCYSCRDAVKEDE